MRRRRSRPSIVRAGTLVAIVALVWPAVPATAAPAAVDPDVPRAVELTGLTAGVRHTCGLTAAGTAHCWGNDAFGQLGNGTPTGDQAAPSDVDEPHRDFWRLQTVTGWSHDVQEALPA